jgi:peptidoglycan L-alanyl-D-glutamate endopeptidase CwlK
VKGEKMHKADIESRDMSLLVPDFREEIEKVLADLKAAGTEFRPFFTLRGPASQARLFGIGRTRTDMEAAARTMANAGAKRLSKLVLEATVSPRSKRVTNALPGRSWHQWGQAVDLFRFKDGAAVWATGEYKPLVEAVRAANLTSGASWGDAVHVQDTSLSAPAMPWAAVEEAMAKRFKL